jgi:tetratricopeptide (TPR) repeat protein
MSNLIIETLGCPNCGAPYEKESKSCKYCGSILIVTDLSLNLSVGLDASQASKSLEKWRKKINENPEDAEAQFALGLSYLNLKLEDQAASHFLKATQLRPEAADAHYNLAITLFKPDTKIDSSEWARIMNEIDLAVKLAPAFKEAGGYKHFFLARKFDNVDEKLALEEYKKAVEVCPSIPIFQSNISATFFNVKDYKNSELHAQLALNLTDQLPLAWQNLISAKVKLKKYKDAIEAGENSIKAIPFSGNEKKISRIYVNLAYAYFLNKEKKKSFETLKKAQSFDAKGVNADTTYKSWDNSRGKIWLIILIIAVIIGIIVCNIPR